MPVCLNLLGKGTQKVGLKGLGTHGVHLSSRGDRWAGQHTEAGSHEDNCGSSENVGTRRRKRFREPWGSPEGVWIPEETQGGKLEVSFRQTEDTGEEVSVWGWWSEAELSTGRMSELHRPERKWRRKESPEGGTGWRVSQARAEGSS